MRHPSIITLLITLIMANTVLPAFSVIKSGIKYSIPIDYEKFSEEELEDRASVYYFNAQNSLDNKINTNMTNALVLYTILQNKNPEKISYAVKLGILYDKINEDRYAKGNFSRAIKTDSSRPEAYYYFGDFYYKREDYRKALTYFKQAYKKGFDKNYDLLYRMGDIYEKFGDTRSALKYLKDAQNQNPNPELENKIKRIEASDLTNKEFYSNTRIRG